jgi:hypothetical protein
MNLASNSVIIPPQVTQGAEDLAMVLTCNTAVTGSFGELPTVTVPEGDITFNVTGMTNVNYAAPGNSYPSEFQLLALTVSVAPGAMTGLRSLVVTNPPQPGLPPPPAVAAPAMLCVAPS